MKILSTVSSAYSITLTLSKSLIHYLRCSTLNNLTKLPRKHTINEMCVAVGPRTRISFYLGLVSRVYLHLIAYPDDESQVGKTTSPAFHCHPNPTCSTSTCDIMVVSRQSVQDAHILTKTDHISVENINRKKSK